jgi:hypothetical protein
METNNLLHQEYDDKPVLKLLCSYLKGDRLRAVAEVSALMAEGRSLKDACEVVIASSGFEESFY